jgi:hypothetical protein
MTLYIKSSGSWSAQNLYLGRVGENKYRTVTIDASIWVADWPDCIFSLIYRRPDGLTYPAVIETSCAVITWAITDADTAVKGDGSIELRLLSGDVIGKTDSLPCTVTEAITGEGSTPADPAPDWLDTIARDVQTIETTVSEFTAVTIPAAEDTITAKADAEIIRVGEVGTTQIALATVQADRSVTAANAAEVSQADAADSKTVASQALADLLAMLGTNIATLTDGKLTIDQLPDLALISYKKVANRTAMLALNAQPGDCAQVITDDDGFTHLYALMDGGNPAVYSDWLQLNTPNSYVSEAGHATTADTAANADAVNGHRIVHFASIAELEAAVKVSGTLYYAPYNEE